MSVKKTNVSAILLFDDSPVGVGVEVHVAMSAEDNDGVILHQKIREIARTGITIVDGDSDRSWYGGKKNLQLPGKGPGPSEVNRRVEG
mmetsp:Transcript_29792/g.70036  ORF Transcript_29792/g.70036 Transcript_29792/m.70036 type:complete len:88 (+) Transcript_29792:839-1102(+)